ncbi:hypothetical protein AQPE_2662 [Aquipluma nitroreducens]|uniref:Uncharacterized protein n=1 Tax=Aquipluma nitroreducens TaxID=2010828 RepID=A0A5K7SAA9_9BACT|nr:hypothetical protein AQPE_2662 [Aquipluma nitroreducens]
MGTFVKNEYRKEYKKYGNNMFFYVFQASDVIVSLVKL